MFSPDGRSVSTASTDGTARVWDAETGKLVLVLNGHLDWVLNATFSPDGARILTASRDHTARLWSATASIRNEGHVPGTGPDKGRVLLQHNGPVRGAVFSPDGRRVLTASDDNTVRLWDANSGDQIALYTTHGAGQGTAAFSLDGTLIAMPDGNTVIIRDANTGKEFSVLRGHSAGLSLRSCDDNGTCAARLLQAGARNLLPPSRRLLPASYLSTNDIGRNANLAW